MANLATIISTIKTEGVYGGSHRKYRGAACGSGAAQCGKAAPGRGDHHGDASPR
jgi:hypothetical protein